MYVFERLLNVANDIEKAELNPLLSSRFMFPPNARPRKKQQKEE